MVHKIVISQILRLNMTNYDYYMTIITDKVAKLFVQSIRPLTIVLTHPND